MKSHTYLDTLQTSPKVVSEDNYYELFTDILFLFFSFFFFFSSAAQKKYIRKRNSRKTNLHSSLIQRLINLPKKRKWNYKYKLNYILGRLFRHSNICWLLTFRSDWKHLYLQQRWPFPLHLTPLSTYLKRKILINPVILN